jgi:hypothetical protein
VAGRDPLLAVQRLGEQLDGGVVGVAPLGQLGRAHGVVDRQHGGVGRRSPGVVVGERREVLGMQLLDGRGDAGVHAGAPQLEAVLATAVVVRAYRLRTPPGPVPLATGVTLRPAAAVPCTPQAAR